jgi:predicted ATPase
VQGEEFLSTVLAASLEADELDLEERLDRLERVHRLIQTRTEEELPDGSLAIRYRFAHSLYQNYLYADLLTKRRILLHRQAGEAMVHCYQGQTGRIATALAMHFERGRDFPRAVEHLAQAGDNASRLFVYTQACEHFSAALELADKQPEQDRWMSRVTLYKKRGDANLSRGRTEDAEADYNSVSGTSGTGPCGARPKVIWHAVARWWAGYTRLSGITTNPSRRPGPCAIFRRCCKA